MGPGHPEAVCCEDAGEVVGVREGEGGGEVAPFVAGDGDAGGEGGGDVGGYVVGEVCEDGGGGVV